MQENNVLNSTQVFVAALVKVTDLMWDQKEDGPLWHNVLVQLGAARGCPTGMRIGQ